MKTNKSYWSPFYHDGKAVDLGHLEPFDLSVLGIRRRLTIVFGHHTFTRSFQLGDDPSQRCFDDRVFCIERYDFSHHLPRIIWELPGTKLYQTWEANAYLSVASVVQVGSENYHVFLTTKRDDQSKKIKRVKIIVESAYVDNASSYIGDSKPNTIRFENLIENTFMGRPITFQRK